MDRWKFSTARDLNLSPLERLSSVERESNLIEFLGAHSWRAATLAYLKAMHAFQVFGKENIPETTPFVMLANHESHFDAICLVAALPPKLAVDIRPVAADDTFFKTRTLSLFTALTVNALPISRKKPRAAVRELLMLRERLLAGRDGLILFPEGTRSRDGKMLEFKKGIGMLVAETDIPVLPCYIDGAFQAFPPSAKLPRKHKISLHIGTACNFSEIPNTDSGWIHIAKQLEATVKELGSSAQEANSR